MTDPKIPDAPDPTPIRDPAPVTSGEVDGRPLPVPDPVPDPEPPPDPAPDPEPELAPDDD